MRSTTGKYRLCHGAKFGMPNFNVTESSMALDLLDGKVASL